MNLRQFQIEASRTMVVMDARSNREHSVLGVISELGELADIYKKNLAYKKPIDHINKIEEIIDVYFYLVNEATFLNVELPENLDSYSRNIYGNEIEDTDPGDLLLQFVIDCIDLNDIETTVRRFTRICELLGVSIEEIESGFDKVIAKLKVRFPDGFNETQALERNLLAERRALEN
jgi:NTP pyrophosphatase (non-canonical NTP hydrolase)